MARSDIAAGLPTYREQLEAAGTDSPGALGINSGLSGLLTGLKLRQQEDAAKQDRLAQAEKILLERSQAAKEQAQAEATTGKEARLETADKEKGDADKEYRNQLLQLKRDELNYKKKLLDAHTSGNNKDVLKIKSAFDKTYNQPLSDAQAALDEFKQTYEDAIKEGSVVSPAKSPLTALKSRTAEISGGAVSPAFATFRKSLKTLVPSLQKGLGINRTSTAEINALTKGAPSGFEEPEVGRRYIKTIQDVLDKKKKENADLIKSQVDLLRTGQLGDVTSSNPMDMPASAVTKPSLESFMEE